MEEGGLAGACPANKGHLIGYPAFMCCRSVLGPSHDLALRRHAALTPLDAAHQQDAVRLVAKVLHGLVNAAKEVAQANYQCIHPQHGRRREGASCSYPECKCETPVALFGLRGRRHTVWRTPAANSWRRQQLWRTKVGGPSGGACSARPRYPARRIMWVTSRMRRCVQLGCHATSMFAAFAAAA